MGMAKIPQRTLWAKITWHAKKKRKRRKRKMMTISKHNKWVVLSLLKLKDDKLFLQGIWNIPIFYYIHKKRHEDHKVQKSKIWGISIKL